MLDLRWIREDPDAFDCAMARHGLPPQSPVILDLDTRRRAVQTELQELQADRNAASKEIGSAKQQGRDAEPVMRRVAELKERLSALEGHERTLAETLDQALAMLPNILADDVPKGEDETENIEIRKHGAIPRIDNPKDHVALGEALNMMDFEAASRMSGARFVFLRGQLARLERAIGQFMLDVAVDEHGYTECSVPLLVRSEALYGTGQLPRFNENTFQTTDERWLIPTSEVPLTNFVMDKILEAEDLPLRLTGLTPCFRSEAGAAGKDTRGMIRQHQFWKVELVSITHPEESEAEHERLVGCAETILQRLGLPFRTLLMCEGETRGTARKKFDLEVWLPGQNTYREISSCSNCGDFQARRMKARFRTRGEKETRFVHTLNGSGVAVGRALVAVMENYQNPDGSIAVPAALAPYMGGITRIERHA
jgi:seryl-tRNA synthetase